ncbi:Ycf48-like protein [Polaribacter huanghezhanensis]|uniref:WD40/YVTN/BNR-like repeat-containing protein n=1 Tax=Polaribacter huanghezhanensis TaxID=1354726 RepID=UPI00264A4255|nr:YCF48-related protein [Polaribacter huanghezhanensis]WKD86692.1 Ycf48-like protein [Polaribacter huanghezhanensis]
MKKISLLFCLAVIGLSCKQEHVPRNFETVSIQKFDIDSTSIRAIIAVNANEVLFAGSRGDIGLTDDGGKTWNIEHLKYQDSIVPHFRSLAKTSSAVFALSVENPALLFKIQSGEKKVVYKEEHEKVFYDAMTFLDDKTGIAIGDPIDGCTSIIMTNDGGKTWRKIDCANLPEVNEGEASFAASNTNIAFYKKNIWVVTGGTKARVLKSTDKGKTWEVIETPMIQGNGPQGIYSVDFYDKNNGIIVGGDFSKPNENKANKAITTDGGKTWTLVADGQAPNYKSCVKYIPGTKGKEVIAVGKTGVSFSNDGGITWKDISKDGYYAIDFVDKNTAWLSGHQKIGKLVLK